MRTSIWLVRHGQTVANRARRYLGHSDSPLTTYGQRQHEAVVRRLRALPFTHAIVSPTERTRALAAAITQDRPSIAIVEDARWREIDQGQWEGLTYREVLQRFPGDAQARWVNGINGKPTGGESLAEVATRVGEAWHELRSHYVGGRVIVTTHATPIQLVLCFCCQTPVAEHWRWRIDLGSLTALDIYGSSIIIRTVNSVPPIR